MRFVTLAFALASVLCSRQATAQCVHSPLTQQTRDRAVAIVGGVVSKSDTLKIEDGQATLRMHVFVDTTWRLPDGVKAPWLARDTMAIVTTGEITTLTDSCDPGPVTGERVIIYV